ncbi:MAG: (2Fe-2S)-binding protein [Myxococcales bacterium]|nr:(2Fe-2S)-binding protein [Myxococcales bacterium]
MYVCICRVVTQSRIRASIDAGASTVDEVTLECGAGGDCGSCRDEIQTMLDKHDASDCDHCPRAHRAASASATR